jgi:hypothetical protein
MGLPLALQKRSGALMEGPVHGFADKVLQPGGGCSAPHLGKHLTAEKLDAGEDVVLTHPGPADAHREVIDAGAVLGKAAGSSAPAPGCEKGAKLRPTCSHDARGAV